MPGGITTLSSRKQTGIDRVSDWRLLPFGSFPAGENMAIDEAVFRVVGRAGGPPTLRLYGWSSPAVSIGFFQDAAAEIDLAACRRAGVEVVRRPTGGRAVYHDDDLTYAVVAPERNPLFPASIVGTYQVISRGLVRGLAGLGLAAELSPGDEGSGAGTTGAGAGAERSPGKTAGRLVRTPPAACFAVPSRHELLVAGRKICGSAQVRSRGAFLQQGSLLMSFAPEKTAAVLHLPGGTREERVAALRARATSLYEHLPRSVTREDVCRAVVEAFQELWQVSFLPGGLLPEEEELKNRLFADKYGRTGWNLAGGKGDKGAKEKI